MMEEIAASLKQLVSDPHAASHAWLAPYQGRRDGQPHHFLLFLKPEATALARGVQVERVLELVLGQLYAWHITVGGARVLRGDYLERHRLMDQHYGVINSISHQGRPAITAAAEEVLRQQFAAELNAGAKVLGGHQFLEALPAFSPLALSTLSDNVGSAKLGGGTYAINVTALGTRYLVLNAFHPYQLEPYYDPKAAIVVLECFAAQPWAALRQELAGATNPAKAQAGSIRSLLLEQKEEVGMREVSQGANGIHLSAGPLEGMVEILRFFSDHDQGTARTPEETTFGALLGTAGLEGKTVAALAGNPGLRTENGEMSAFDLTEEVDADPARTILARAAQAL